MQTDMPAKNEQDEPHLWFAMRVTYRRELKAKAELEERGCRVFVPMVMSEIRDKATKRVRRVEVPAVHNLIFVNAMASVLQDFKKDREYLQYITTGSHTEAKHKIIVPDAQMEAFIRLYEQGQAEVLESEDLLPGTAVRVVAGPFEGMTGTFQRVNGRRNRYFVITLDGLINIGSTLIRPDMVVKV